MKTKRPMKITVHVVWPCLFSLVCVLPCSCKQTPSGELGMSGVDPRGSFQGDTTIDYLVAGLEFAAATQAVLAKNLIEAINRDGVAQALSYCNVRAHPLTDSLARSLNAGIRRVTDKPRNPANAANADELAYIGHLKAGMATGQVPEGTLREEGGKVVGYYPILTNALCLQCHGNPAGEIQPMTLALINALYPDDQAVGYGIQQVRGLWVVEMDIR